MKETKPTMDWRDQLKGSLSDAQLREHRLSNPTPPVTINIAAVRNDATVITGQADSWYAAVTEVLRWADDPFYSLHGQKPIEVVFLSAGQRRLERHTVASLRADLTELRVPDAPRARA
jgi:hypothetical protein